jgi:hypothetical protein
MKALHLIPMIAFIAIIKIAVAQNDNYKYQQLKDLNLNFSVPDLPAFNALQSEPANLLKPSSFKEISVISDQFFNGTEMIIPKSIAIEVAPITLLRHDNLTLKSYQESPALYNLRFSLGSLRDSLNVSKVAIGFRSTLIDKGDIKFRENLKVVYELLSDKSETRINALSDELDKIGKTIEDYEKDSEVKDFINKKLSKNEILKTFKDSCWNNERLDVALAIVGSSPDSLARNIRFNSLVGWVSWALPINEKSGQFIIGGNFIAAKQGDSFYYDASLPARIYFGNNEMKFFGEGQYTYKGIPKTNNILIDLGCEYYIGNGFWLHFNAGLDKDLTNKSSKLVSNFKISYALPGSLD